MKRQFLSLISLLLLNIILKAQTINFVSTTFFSKVGQTCTVSVQLGVQLNSNGNNCTGTKQICALDFQLAWSQDMNFLSSQFFPSGSMLDDAGNLSSNPPDNGDWNSNSSGRSTISASGKTYNSFFYHRSTNFCSNVITVPCSPQIVPLFIASFSWPMDSCNKYTDIFNASGSNNSYITAYNTSGTITDTTKKIYFIVNKTESLSDVSGNKCNADGTIKNANTLTEDPGANTFVNTAGAVLPANDLNFEIQRKNYETELIWNTSIPSAAYYSGFEIERKVSDKFESIAFIPAQKNQDNNSNSTIQYTYVDNFISTAPFVYYRLKQINLFANSTYSTVKSIRNARGTRVLLYPNPAAGFINVILPSTILNDIDISVVDMSGRVIRTYKQLKGGTFVITGLNKGFYLLKIQSKYMGQIDSKRFTVL